MIEIPKDKTVDLLKQRIKETWAPRLNHINYPDLSLWQVSFPIADLQSTDPKALGPKLRPERKLANLFSTEPDESLIHIFVRLPGQGEYFISRDSILLISIFRRWTLPPLWAAAVCVQAANHLRRQAGRGSSEVLRYTVA